MDVSSPIELEDAKAVLAALASRAAEGEDIVLSQEGKPVAMLTRVPSSLAKSLLGLFQGKIRIADDFDAPLPEFREYT